MESAFDDERNDFVFWVKNHEDEQSEKSQKPTDYDISFKYICNDCGNEHGYFLEVKTKIQIVCDCSQIIEPRCNKRYRYNL